MSTKKIELKVSINCQKCKTEVLKAITKVRGVDEVKLDAEKGIVTVLGSVDPVCVAARIRKAGNRADILSVGPPKKPDDPPKPKPQPPEQLPPCCKQCQHVAVSFVTCDSAPVCSIL